jgi:rhodanese-related sulfurtransferase
MSTNQSSSPSKIQRDLDQGNAILIDVREPHESASERIACAILSPLSSFDANSLPIVPGRPVYLHCKSGGRSGRALDLCNAAGLDIAGHMEGGIEAWKSAGLSVEGSEERRGLSVPQAVTATASLVVFASMIGSIYLGPLALIPGAAASLMMLQASFTGFCPAGRVFAALGFRPG